MCVRGCGRTRVAAEWRILKDMSGARLECLASTMAECSRVIWEIQELSHQTRSGLNSGCTMKQSSGSDAESQV